jgi:hypothetical protein
MLSQANHEMFDPRTDALLPDFLTQQRDWLLKHVSVNH